MISGILFVLTGSVFFSIGWQIFRKQRIDLIIKNHCDKVSEQNIQAYCTLFGIGILIMGIGFFLSAIFIIFNRSASVFIPMTVGLLLGIVLLLSAIIKYNH